jgi:solute carrier family 25 oxoglutarate transporter 11
VYFSTYSVVVGAGTGATAAFISCPIEVACVRMSNDATLPVDQRRNYKGMQDVFTRIYKEEGPSAFYRGVIPFSQRAALVGVFQVATMDQFTDLFQETLGYKKNTVPNVFCSAMSSGLIYSLATMPLEACKNRMASQKPDPTTGKLPYTSTLQALRTISANEGFLALYNVFAPYYIRCGGHTVCMFVAIQTLRSWL